AELLGPLGGAPGILLDPLLHEGAVRGLQCRCQRLHGNVLMTAAEDAEPVVVRAGECGPVVHGGGYPDVDDLAHIGAKESFARDTDNFIYGFSILDSSAKHAAVSSKAPLPVVVA